MKVNVNLDNLMIGDLETLDRASAGDLPMTELVNLLDRVVEGNVRELPLPAMRDIVEALNEQVDALANPEVDGKN